MSTPICLRCLRRSLFPPISSRAAKLAATRAAFSTTPSRSANPPKKQSTTAKRDTSKTKSLRLSKNKRVVTGRPPAPGERKALRKRVVLSNSNALEVAGLEDFTAENVRRATLLRQLEGRVVGFGDATVNVLRALEGFKPTQGWGLFRRPASLVRAETVELGEMMQTLKGEKSMLSLLLAGERGSGKSVLQLQAMAVAYLQGWIIVHIPEAKDITIGHTAFQPVKTTDGQTIYIQPQYTAELLDKIAQANRGILSDLRLSRQHQLPIPIQSNISLARLVELGANDPQLAWPIWQALWAELTAPSQPDKQGLHRPPVLVSADGVDHIMRNSAYIDVETKPIHSHELAIVRDFTALLAGKTALPNGGMVLAAISKSTAANSPTFAAAHGHPRQFARASRDRRPKLPEWNPYDSLDQRVAEVMENVEVKNVDGLSKQEARSVMEYYARSGMMRGTITEGLVSEKWTLAGGGLVGELEKGAVRARF
ncbi:hypothetical protein BAUCODRAFT_79913 [Baudoinia panamericana UAMH 10762]|uniref:Small ribosomal subunit protein mS29 n=1 Tax=Baudoinia panamericana (strain UAMH 10762) TaxID=717646 RepID=M2MIX4_BAUPA|nr:uncharacterized protein BAUCODRAFT_79913 [Baudoinia panamericana UAMH 10762]EMC91223.1 hypothetical protein BAUCODRAFT_79913 [Baudoinia panamericana UAMH 10762]